KMSSIISDYIMKKYSSPFRADEADMQRVFGSGMLEVQRELRFIPRSALPGANTVSGVLVPTVFFSVEVELP
ncbi:MAG: hypothetical protein ACYDAX_11560, partial [Desulfobacteria bacterium]